MSHQADMSHTSSPPKRPRLSLQIKTPSAPVTLNKSSTALKADIDPSSPTAFNTLSNAYAAAISLASPPPISAAAATTATSFSASSARPKSLRLITSAAPQTAILPSQRIQTPGPFTVVYPDTPTTLSQAPTPVTAHPNVSLQAPFTFTPPQSAHPSSPSSTLSTGTNTMATATASEMSKTSRLPRTNISVKTTLAPSPFPSSPHTPRRRATTGSSTPYNPPYTHPRTLRSILRNSPLPARTAVTVATAEKGGRRVGYDNPLTQTITTERYVRSHVELLGEDEAAAESGGVEAETGIEAVMAYDGATRDGGQTPGPFEEMRRRMAGLGEEDGGRKRKREKKRAWVWTIGVGEDGEEEGGEKTAEEGEGEGGLEMLRPSTYVPTPPTVIVAAPLEGMSAQGGRMEVDPPERPTSSQSI
ncbi:hypothetical protein V493_05836 [Pseudogymnoascus sp. VKM F-4281 (FW-2241)]|nr:hypothetical protein V493_05836 [Pseudogymnoascus sp. VKM F-4281 (FW-2241)]